MTLTQIDRLPRIEGHPQVRSTAKAREMRMTDGADKTLRTRLFSPQ